MEQNNNPNIIFHNLNQIIHNNNAVFQLEEEKQYEQSTIDEDRIVEVGSYLDDVKCLVCLNIANNPYTCCYCSAIFCQACIQDWLKKKNSCPQCNKQYNQFNHVVKNEFARKIIGNIKVSCVYKREGCKSIIQCTLKQMQEHESTCGFQPLNCIFHPCNAIFLKKDKYLHESICDFKPMPQQFIPIKSTGKTKQTAHFYVIRKKLEDHQQKCDLRPVPCKHCGKEKIQKDLSSHQKMCNVKQGFKEAANSFVNFFSSKPKPEKNTQKEAEKNQVKVICRNYSVQSHKCDKKAPKSFQLQQQM